MMLRALPFLVWVLASCAPVATAPVATAAAVPATGMPSAARAPAREPAPPGTTQIGSRDTTTTHTPRSAERTAESEDACGSDHVAECHAAALDFYYDKTHARDSRALDLFTRACSLGYAPSCNGVGTMMAEGRAVAQDLPGAVKYFHRACAGDGSTGCEHLAAALEAGRGVAKNAELAKAARTRGACLFQVSLKKDHGGACVPLPPLPP